MGREQTQKNEVERVANSILVIPPQQQGRKEEVPSPSNISSERDVDKTAPRLALMLLEAV